MLAMQWVSWESMYGWSMDSCMFAWVTNFVQIADIVPFTFTSLEKWDSLSEPQEVLRPVGCLLERATSL